MKDYTTIGSYAFYDTLSLTSVQIPEGITKIGLETFAICPNLTKIISYTKTPPTIYFNTFKPVAVGGVLYYPANSDYSSWLNDSNYYLGYYEWSGYEIGNYPECPDCPECPECSDECPECELTTYYNNGLRFGQSYITNLDFVKMINWENVNGKLSYAFFGVSSDDWSGLSSINFDGQSVDMSYAFSKTNIKQFNADTIKAGEITNMYETFGYSSLVTFTAGNTPINGDITVAFNDCYSLTSIDFGTAESTVTGGDMLFKDNSNNENLRTILMGNCTFNDTYYSRFYVPRTVKNIEFGNKFTGQLHLKGELDDIYAEDICSKLYDFTNDPDGLGLTASPTGGGSIFYNSLSINALVYAMERGWYCQRIY